MIDNAVIFDCETFPNCFSLAMECLHSNDRAVWEISERRDDRQYLMQWFDWLRVTQTPMIGFNNVNFDYPVIHALFHNPQMTVAQIYEKAMAIIKGGDRWGHSVWASDRFAPQIDLFKIHHFDNKAKSTSLKWLQINMRSESVQDMPVKVGTILHPHQIADSLIPYNMHDVSETKRFAHYSMTAIKFREGLIPEFGADVLNWSDSKIGSEKVIKALGKELCYDYTVKPRKTRQTPRSSVALNDIIFPYIRFEHPELNRVLEYLRTQTLRQDEFDESTAIKTKGVFTGLTATIGGVEFCFGVGGIHGSVERKVFHASEQYAIKDIDVASLYPSIAIVNRLAPAHLGEPFVAVYAQLPKERKRWQEEKGKKCVEANAIKLGSNSVYGNSNNMFSPFYDPQFTMTITINGQLLLCMLAEQLIKIPTLQLIQINTDGMTYVVDRQYLDLTVAIEKWWEGITQLVLEEQFYSRMWVRDVNSYIAESLDGSFKLKGAYWHPDPLNYHESIGDTQPPAWHKNLSNIASTRAAVAAMVHGVDPGMWLRMHTNPYDFMCAFKARGSDILLYDGIETQKTCRYFVAREGASLIKMSPPTGPEGSYKKANGIADAEYARVMQETGGAWDARVCTKNKSQHTIRRSEIVAGYKVQICNHVKDFNFNNINYDWYENEARKLCI